MDHHPHPDERNVISARSNIRTYAVLTKKNVSNINGKILQYGGWLLAFTCECPDMYAQWLPWLQQALLSLVDLNQGSWTTQIHFPFSFNTLQSKKESSLSFSPTSRMSDLEFPYGSLPSKIIFDKPSYLMKPCEFLLLMHLQQLGDRQTLSSPVLFWKICLLPGE